MASVAADSLSPPDASHLTEELTGEAEAHDAGHRSRKKKEQGLPSHGERERESTAVAKWKERGSHQGRSREFYIGGASSKFSFSYIVTVTFFHNDMC
jgi:hypothetical protein